MNYTLTVDNSADEEIRKVILASLVAFNTSKTGPGNGAALAVVLRDATGSVTGGLWGSTGYGWLFTQLLVVPEAMRGQGIGSEIMRCAEREAISRGCHSAWLDTFEFQAREFYEGMGYVCFAELPDYPAGFARFFMKKALRAE